MLFWTELIDDGQLQKINDDSAERPQIIFKHSTRCATSSLVKNRLTKGDLPNSIDFYYLDLIRYRALSNKIADVYGVRHESPQVLIIKDGSCLYHESHSNIYLDEIIAKAV